MADMRTTWDAAARSERRDEYVGDPATARQELDGLFGRLGDDPHGGVCVEVGCGPGRMTRELAERFDRVIAVDVSAEMLDLARQNVTASSVEFLLVSGETLDPLDDHVADVIVCYLVLQHLPSRAHVTGYLGEIGRVLGRGGRAYVQVPVLAAGVRPRLWRSLRALVVPAAARLGGQVEKQPAYRGFRLTDAELACGLDAAGLRVSSRDESPDSPYRYAREVFLRLERA